MISPRRYIKLFLNRFYFPLLVKLSLPRFDSASAEASSIKELVDFTSRFRYGPPIRGLFVHIRAGQEREEITQFLQLLKSRNPRIICEIGTANGGTLFMFTRIAASDGRFVSIDLPWGNFGSGYLSSFVPLFHRFALPGQDIILLRKDSHHQETLDELVKYLNGDFIDVLFIDGDHSYEGVAKDFMMYRPLVRAGGIIAFHDIVPSSPEWVGGVPRFWQEIKSAYNTEEIVQNWNQVGAGIGIIHL